MFEGKLLSPNFLLLRGVLTAPETVASLNVINRNKKRALKLIRALFTRRKGLGLVGDESNFSNIVNHGRLSFSLVRLHVNHYTEYDNGFSQV